MAGAVAVLPSPTCLKRTKAVTVPFTVAVEAAVAQANRPLLQALELEETERRVVSL
jgi:hypothetical protein